LTAAMSAVWSEKLQECAVSLVVSQLAVTT
jgi:hypothetical protein